MTSLKIAGCLSLLASLAHLAIIVGGPSWYRFFGAGEQLATMAEQGLLRVVGGWGVAQISFIENGVGINYLGLLAARRAGLGGAVCF